MTTARPPAASAIESGTELPLTKFLPRSLDASDVVASHDSQECAVGAANDDPGQVSRRALARIVLGPAVIVRSTAVRSCR